MRRGIRLGGPLTLVLALMVAGVANGATLSRTGAGVTADYTYTVDPSFGTAGWPTTQDQSLTVTAPGRPVQTFDTAALKFQVAENQIDPATALVVRDITGDGDPEILLTTYWGGAHCCYEAKVVWWSPASGRYVLTSQFWGNSFPRLQKLNADRVTDFVGVDDRFAYGFNASYASSTFPGRVWNFQNGRFVIVTRKFPAVGVRTMNQAWRNYVLLRRDSPRERVNALAAYLAGASDAGVKYRRAAWKRVANAERAHPAVLRGLKRGVVRLGYAVG